MQQQSVKKIFLIVVISGNIEIAELMSKWLKEKKLDQKNFKQI